jgi:hypothetical protein
MFRATERDIGMFRAFHQLARLRMTETAAK